MKQDSTTSDCGLGKQGDMAAPELTSSEGKEVASAEKAEEEKLMAKYGGMSGLMAKGKGPSAFLQKKLQHRKYFDSGDYNVAKSKGLKLPQQEAAVSGSGGGAETESGSAAAAGGGGGGVGRPAAVVAARAIDKPRSLGGPFRPAKHTPTLGVVVDKETEDGSTSPTGLEIPRPDTVPQRKSSIVYPTASKLSPQPHLHHHDSLPPVFQEDSVAI